MISDEDLDEILEALDEAGFELPTWSGADNREALRKALESTEAWSRYRIY
jgi:hypothetical protein